MLVRDRTACSDPAGAPAADRRNGAETIAAAIVDALA
jgi:hypothetical protein